MHRDGTGCDDVTEHVARAGTSQRVRITGEHHPCVVRNSLERGGELGEWPPLDVGEDLRRVAVRRAVRHREPALGGKAADLIR